MSPVTTGMNAITAIVAAGLHTVMTMIASPNFPFIFLFIFRYLRLIVHIISFRLYKPTPVPAHPTLHPSDCTVIIPTVDPTNADFEECLRSVLANKPGAILIVTVGKQNVADARVAARRHSPNIRVTSINIANKRHQVSHAIPYVKTAITVLVDDHVFWPSTNFLPTLLAPFEDPRIGAVGTHKRVRRNTDTALFNYLDIWNFLGCIYLERHNFEITATNAVDGGVFVISGRTSAHRTSILADPDFLSGFKTEHFFFGLFGPLNADDDNFITRWEVKHGWKIAIQNCRDATIETTLGTYPKFLSQCLRWVRTTWRSNSASLFTDRTVWTAQPWCVYAVYISSFFNFALFYDAALMYTLTRTDFVSRNAIWLLVGWILLSKMVKLIPHFLRCPADVVYFPIYLAFAYFHSLIKLYAGLSFWVTAWGGRVLKDAEAEDEDDSSDNNDNNSGNDDDDNNGGNDDNNGGNDDDNDGDDDKSDSDYHDAKSNNSESSDDSNQDKHAPISVPVPRSPPMTKEASPEMMDTPWGPICLHPRRLPRRKSPDPFKIDTITPANVREATLSWTSSASTRTSETKEEKGLQFGYVYPSPPPSYHGDDHDGDGQMQQTKATRICTSVLVERVWWRGEDCERLHCRKVPGEFSADEGVCDL